MRPIGDLYSTAAQILPLVLGLLAFELRTFTLRESSRGAPTKREWFTVSTSLLLLLLLVLGEAAAIRTLAAGTETAGARSAVLSSVFAGGLLLVLGILEPTAGSLFGERPSAVVSNVIVVLAVCGWLLFG